MAGPISSRPYEWHQVPWTDGQVLTRGTHAGLPVLTWGRADREQLATLRQLRELGLRPGGAQPVAVLAFGHSQPYRRTVEHAALYRIADAVPKRTATPAQRVAIDKALAVRRTCERCETEQDYYLSTVSRLCGPCEDTTGFWDEDRRGAGSTAGVVDVPVQRDGSSDDATEDTVTGAAPAPVLEDGPYARVGASTADAVARAHEAVQCATTHRTTGSPAAERERAAELARWHADDHTDEHDHVDDDARALEGTSR